MCIRLNKTGLFAYVMMYKNRRENKEVMHNFSYMVASLRYHLQSVSVGIPNFERRSL